ncbi:MAG: fibronectin type III domain-containing protein, partial [Planctomycetaceae bacterium]|nr:fibronectin type III domain-containing protein [Planctomycetaceae bacterium]
MQRSRSLFSSDTAILRLALLLHATILVAGSAQADAPLEGTTPAQWRLLWKSDPATSATLCWSTAAQGKVHAVKFSERGRPDTEGTRVAVSGRYTGGQLELYYHHAHLTDLKPETAYDVQMISDDEVSPILYFVTAPAGDREFSILHGGDSRSDRATRRKMNERIARLFEASHQNDTPNDDILAFAHGGDYIASGPNLAEWSEWMSDHELTTTSAGRLLPTIPARGNHDHGRPFHEVFDCRLLPTIPARGNHDHGRPFHEVFD